MYLFFYYLGSSLAGTTGGFFWYQFGWPGVVGFLGALLLLAFYISFRLKALQR